MTEDETVIQIAASGTILYGLTNEGNLFYWNTNINNWTKAGE